MALAIYEHFTVEVPVRLNKLDAQLLFRVWHSRQRTPDVRPVTLTKKGFAYEISLDGLKGTSVRESILKMFIPAMLRHGILERSEHLKEEYGPAYKLTHTGMVVLKTLQNIYPEISKDAKKL